MEEKRVVWKLNGVKGFLESKDYDSNERFINELLCIDKSFDVVEKKLEFGGRKASYYFIDGFCKDEIMEKIMEFLYGLKEDDVPEDGEQFVRLCVPYGEAAVVYDKDSFIRDFMAGVPMLLVDGYDVMIGTDFRTYPARGVEEPEKDRVLRGARDGFVETLVFNTALIRRRIRDINLVMDIHSVGKTSKTDVVVAYMKGRIDEKLLDKVIERINQIEVDALSMNLENFLESFYPHKWYNPFPRFKTTERPDVTAASINEGNIIIMVDNSPAAIIVPTTLFDIIESADDYYFPVITGTYLRFSRLIINIVALLLTPTFLLLINNPESIPSWLQFIRIKEVVNVPVLLQLLLLEFAIDGMRLAALNTPNMLSTPLSVIAGIVLGDFTVSSGWFNSEIMLYMAVVAIANYSQVNFELGYALKFFRIITLVFTAAFGVYGYAGGLILTCLCLAFNKTFAGKSYLYPLIPFDGKKLFERLFRYVEK